MLSRCLLKGGAACQRQGGSGMCFHTEGYVHPFESGFDGSNAISSADSSIVDTIKGLDDWFGDPDLVVKVLNHTVDQAINTVSEVRKSLFDFDVNTYEGAQKVLHLLPILDEDVVKLLMQELWPGYPTNDESFDHKRARLQIKGFLLDEIQRLSEESIAGSGSTVFDAPEGNENDQDDADEAGTEVQADQEAAGSQPPAGEG